MNDMDPIEMAGWQPAPLPPRPLSEQTSQDFATGTTDEYRLPDMSEVEARAHAFLDSTDMGRHMKSPSPRLNGRSK